MPTPVFESPAARIARSAADIRGWIVDEIARSLNIDRSEVDTAAPLDRLGVDSLGAIGMTGGLAAYLDLDLPATLMWDYTSIDSLAEALADRDGPAPSAVRPGVVDLQPQGEAVPLFCFPGQRGHPVSFAPLAGQVGLPHPFYGLVVPGMNGEQKPLTSVEEIAGAMLEKVRLVQAKGPYQLAGYSFGGLLAYEAAQQLAAMGETVSLLAIYDTFTPSGCVLRAPGSNGPSAHINAQSVPIG